MDSYGNPIPSTSAGLIGMTVERQPDGNYMIVDNQKIALQQTTSGNIQRLPPTDQYLASNDVEVIQPPAGENRPFSERHVSQDDDDDYSLDLFGLASYQFRERHNLVNEGGPPIRRNLRAVDEEEYPPDDVSDDGSDVDDEEESESEEKGHIEYSSAHEQAEEFSFEPLVWSQDYSSFRGRRETFTANSGPKIEGTSPIGLFEYFWDQDVMENITKETNEYAWEKIVSATEREEGIPPHSRLNSWVEMSVPELYTLFSVFIMMSLCVRGRIDRYWTTDRLAMPGFRKAMTFWRYVQLTSMLHFADNRLMTAEGPDRKLAKVRPIIDHFNKKSKAAYIPRRDICIDESLLLWKGRLSWRQCILCEAISGYSVYVIFHTGKDSLEPPPVPGNSLTKATSRIVISLIEDYLQKGHTLYMDNFYNSVPLCLYLKSQKTDVVGTLSRCRVDTPDAIKRVPDNVEPGTVVSRHCGLVSVTTWKDKKLVTTVSTYHQDNLALGRKSGKDLMKPAVVLDYNKSMGGVDLKDQKLSMFSMERKRGLKWYMKVFRRLVNVSIMNAFIIYCKNMGPGKKLTHRQFREQLFEELLQKYARSVCPKPVSFQPIRRLNNNLMDHVLVQIEMTERASAKGERFKRGRCVRCASLKMQKRVNTYCEGCHVFLCLGTCYKQYHSLEKL